MTTALQLGTPARILVAGDSADDAAPVAESLSAAFDGVEVSTEADRAGADLDRVKPGVVVLAFRAIEQAEAYRSRALGLGEAAPESAPRTVLLCARDQVEAAFERCRRGLFDDYVPYWPQPAEDRHRLAMAVQAARRNVAPRPTVMVVEDDAFAAQLIAIALQSEPWALLFAADAAEALSMLEQARPNVILMDVNLPDIDGLDLTQRLKSTPALAAIPVLTLTGEARRETLLRSHAAGAAGFIVKPFTREALLAKITPFMH